MTCPECVGTNIKKYDGVPCSWNMGGWECVDCGERLPLVAAIHYGALALWCDDTATRLMLLAERDANSFVYSSAPLLMWAAQ